MEEGEEDGGGGCREGSSIQPGTLRLHALKDAYLLSHAGLVERRRVSYYYIFCFLILQSPTDTKSSGQRVWM